VRRLPTRPKIGLRPGKKAFAFVELYFKPVVAKILAFERELNRVIYEATD
jgi:hypothetical protein